MASALLNDCDQEGCTLRFDHLTHHVPDLAAAMKDYIDLGFSMDLVRSNSADGTRAAFSRNGRGYWELIGVDDMRAFERHEALRQERYPNLVYVVPLPGAPVHLVPGTAERITTVVLSGAFGHSREVWGLRLAGTN